MANRAARRKKRRQTQRQERQALEAAARDVLHAFDVGRFRLPYPPASDEHRQRALVKLSSLVPLRSPR